MEKHMSWIIDSEMDDVADHRKVDTEPKAPEEIDGREPALENQSEWVRGTNGSLDERYGEKTPDSSVDGMY